MCNPTVAMVAISAASAGLQYKVAKQQQQAAYEQQKRQKEQTKTRQKMINLLFKKKVKRYIIGKIIIFLIS